MPTTFAADREWIGIAPEATPGTAVAPTFTVPVTKFEPEDKPTQLDDTSLRGSMAELYGRYQGVLRSEFSMAGPVYMDTIEHLLVNILGDRTTTGASDPYTHATALLNSGGAQPKTHTLTHWTGVPASTGARVYASACLSSLALKWDAAAKLCTYDAKGMAWGSAVAGTTPTSSPSAVPPLASWRGTLSLAGAQVLSVQTAEIDIKRKVEPHYTISNGQQPYIIQRGKLGVSGKMSIIAESEAPILKLLADTQESLQLVIGNGVTGAGQRQLAVACNLVDYKTAKINTGKATIQYDVAWDAIANTTNAGASGGQSPCAITVINGNAGTVY